MFPSCALGIDVVASARRVVMIIDRPTPMSDLSPLGAVFLVTVKVRGRSIPPRSATQGRHLAAFPNAVCRRHGGFIAAADIPEFVARSIVDVTFVQGFHSLLTVFPLAVASVLDTVA